MRQIKLGTTTLVIATVLCSAVSQAQPAGTKLRAIKIIGGSGGETAIRVACSTPPAFAVFKLEEPPRLVVGISNAIPGKVSKWLDVGAYSVSSVGLTRIRKGSWSGVRVSVNLRRKVTSRVKLEGSDLVIRIVPLIPPAVAARPAPAPAPAPAPVARTKSSSDEARQKKLEAEYRAKLAALTRSAADAERARQISQADANTHRQEYP